MPPQHVSSTDPDEAASLVSGRYLPHRVELPQASRALDMHLSYFDLGAVTVGRLTYGHQARVLTEHAKDFFLTLCLQGQATAQQSGTDPVTTSPGDGVVFSPGSPCDVLWTQDCVQLVLKADATSLEEELSRLVGTSLKQPLRFDFGGGVPAPLAHRWHTLLGMLVDELTQPSGLVLHPRAGRHVEKLVLDGLLLAHPHTYSDAVHRPGPRISSRELQHAVDLLEADPGNAWSMVELANEVHISVRALQNRFRQELGETPTSYLKKVRLRRAHRLLTAATPDETSVRAVAIDSGFLHLGQFVADYREAIGEHPRDTLRGLL